MHFSDVNNGAQTQLSPACKLLSYHHCLSHHHLLCATAAQCPEECHQEEQGHFWQWELPAPQGGGTRAVEEPGLSPRHGRAEDCEISLGRAKRWLELTDQ